MPLNIEQQTRKDTNDMNKRILVPIVTGCVFAAVFAAGCAANKRAKPASIAPVELSTSSTQTSATTTRPSITESTVQKIITVYKEAPTEATTTTTEETTTTAKPTATPKPTAKPTKKPTAKPTKKPTKTPTKKPTAKPTVKKSTQETAKSNTLKTVSNNNTTDTSKKIGGIYRGPWSEITVDATNLQRVKITATIHDQDDSSKASVWKMEGRYNPATGAILYTNGSKINYEYDANNNVAEKRTAYNNGQGKIVISNSMITWHDYQEHIAEDMTFISAKSHDHGSN